MREKVKSISREEFDLAVEALWSEISYQDGLDIRTVDEAKDVPGFLTLGRVYQRKAEEDWASKPATPGTEQVEEALHGLRKLAGIYIRAMIYNGIRRR